MYQPISSQDVQQESIILKFDEEQHKITLLHPQKGILIGYLQSFKKRLFLHHGILIQYAIYATKNNYILLNDITIVHTFHEQISSDIYFFHKIVKLYLHIVPEKTYDSDLFSHFLFFLHGMHKFSTVQKRLFFIKTIFLMNKLPDVSTSLLQLILNFEKETSYSFKDTQLITHTALFCEQQFS